LGLTAIPTTGAQCSRAVLDDFSTTWAVDRVVSMPRIRNAQIDLLKPNGGAHGEEHPDRRSSCVDLVPRLAGVRASRRRSQCPVEVSHLGELSDHRIICFFGASRAEEVLEQAPEDAAPAEVSLTI
jgi:hypothetical protein